MRQLALVALGLSLFAAGCARTDIAPACPDGFDPIGDRCLCNSDQGCPVDMVCKSGVCVCNGDACCPVGFHWDGDGGACTCADDVCCPYHFRYDAPSGDCACAASDCCPEGFAFDADTQHCACKGEQCCPQGFVFVARDAGTDDAGLPPPSPDGGGEFGACACTDTSCCPIDYKWDDLQQACVCAKDACCPADYRFDPAVNGCVCNGNACCPPGFALDPTLQKCTCQSDAACGNLVCNNGTCQCVPGPPGTGGCSADQFCNALGFCQSLKNCTDNSDCPVGTFCDIFSSTCLVNGPAVMDANCPYNQIVDANSASCVPGCRSDSDCELPLTCVINGNDSTGTCQSVCAANDYCPTGEYCGPNDPNGGACPAGECCAAVDNSLCESPCDANTCSGSCLQFIQEGQITTFCGTHCNTESDCPSEFDCGATLHDCSSGGTQACAIAGDGSVCDKFLVENEADPIFLCADPKTGLPQTYESYCAPRSGRCPPDAPP
ncbi:MAG: hypothetical protein JST54_24580 [Deltaproteobacteria bacterium]|nr:hypothetical protein [Deltaproteobacteria bacterium]